VEQQLGTLYRGGVVVHARWWGCVFVQHEVQSGFGPKLPELSCCGPVLGCKKVERGDVGLQPPFLCKNRERRWGVSGMVSGGGCAYLLAWCLGPSCFSLSSLAAHWQAVSPSSVVGCMLVDKRDMLCLAEFETLTIFNHNFDFHCTIFYRSPKIVKIIIYILQIYKNVSTISI